MLLKKSEYAAHRGWKSAGRVSQLIPEGLPVEPNGLIDVDKADAWLDSRRQRVELRIPANTGQVPTAQAPKVTPDIPAMPQSAGGLGNQLLSARVQKEKAQAALTLVKVGERRDELGSKAEGRAESRRAAETVRNSRIDEARSDALALAGQFGLDLGEVQVLMLRLAREHLRRYAAAARAEFERLEAAGA